MTPPFSAEDFFRVFATYNLTVWPVQIVLVCVAVAVVILAFRARNPNGRLVALALGLLWAWMGVAYHWWFFSEINPAAWAFGGAFVLEGALFIRLAWRDEAPRFAAEPDVYGLTGAGLIVYALAVYPALGVLAGHTYPRQPTFGLPCPTTIFTIGVLLWAKTRVPPALLVVPALWSVMGLSAVRYFGVLEDLMLPAAGILGGAMIFRRGRSRTAALRKAHREPPAHAPPRGA